MGVEAARGVVGETQPAGVVFASTSAPFRDRSMAGIVAKR
jgi:3-hydroxy-3-methylglutaryl CoA synthase